jgi:hypothetical protein
MARNRVFRSLLLASGVLLTASCATSIPGSLDEKYFEREANNYLKFEHQGQTVYCQNDANAATLVPYKQCITEAGLRQKVETARLSRNAVQRGGPPYVSTTPGSVSGG